MPFPQTPVGVRVEMDLVGNWSAPVDISSYVYGRDLMTITRGKQNEGTTVDPSTVTMTLNNRDNRFTPRNPTGPYYGQIGRNTRIRVSVPGGTPRMFSVDPNGGFFYAPDTVGTSVTGDIDIRADFDPPGWRFQAGAARPVLAKDGGGSQRSWVVEVGNDGKLKLFWWQTAGGASSSAVSTVPVDFPVTGRKAIRITLDVDNGAGGWTVAFYTSDTISGVWTALGASVTGSGTTGIADTTGINRVYAYGADFYAAEVRNGINGTVVASPNFIAQADGTTTFYDAQLNLWAAASTIVSVTSRRYRFYGEVAAWPQTWDSTGKDVTVTITAAGVLRRLAQGAATLHSTLYRGVTKSLSNVVVYWPMEDANSATSPASGIGGKPMRVTGTPDYAAYSSFLASEPVPTMNGAVLSGDVPSYTVTGTTQVRFLMAVPAGGLPNGTIIARINTTGSTKRWELVYGTGGMLGMNSFLADNTNSSTSGFIAYNVNGKRVQVSLEMVQNGANIDWRFSTLNDDSTNNGYNIGTLNANTVGKVTSIVLAPNGGITDTAFGHLYMQTVQTSLFDLSSQLQAYVGETAGARMVRLCGEEGVSVTVIGDPADSEKMGPQAAAATLLSILQETAATDQGLLHEPRAYLGLVYRTRTALLNSTPTLTLNYSLKHFSALDPVDDDQLVHNDVTLSRLDGSSYRASLESGALSAAPPPNGVGRYEKTLTVNPQLDSQLANLASWRLRQGTIDEARYPRVGVDLARAPYAASASLAAAVVDADVADVVALTSLPAWLSRDSVNQIIRGTVEYISNFTHTLEYVCEPQLPLIVGVYDASAARYSSDGSTLASGVTSSATSLSVATPSGPLWTTSAPEFPFDIIVAGERMTVTAISGTASPQTFTVTRSVNGVSKAQSSGAVVDLFAPAYYAV